MIEIAASKNISGMTIPLTPATAIYGKVINESNEPVVKATVKALKPSYREGERSLQAVQSVQTNDLGEYRLFGLLPGRYFLSVAPIPPPSIEGGTLTTPSGGGGFSIQPLQNILATGNAIDPRALDNSTEPAIYFPGTTDPAAASSIDLKAGASYGAPVLRTIRTRSFGIRGQFVDDVGQPVAVTSASLTRANSNEAVRTNLMSQNRNTFEFSGIIPGVYELSATVQGTNLEKAGRLTINVGNENVENLRLVLNSAIQLKGRIVLNGVALPSELRVQLRGTNGVNGAQITPTAADGSFTVTNARTGVTKFYPRRGSR